MSKRAIAVLMFVAIAIGSCSNPEKQWTDVQKTNTVGAYQAYIRENPNGPHAKEAKARIESLEWRSALAKGKSQLLEALIEKYPHSPSAAIAREKLWSLKWPATTVTQANSVTIMSGGRRNIIGEMSFNSGLESNGLSVMSGPVAGGPNRIVIWRDFSPAEKGLQEKFGLRVGMAFLKSGKGEYKFVRKVDLKLSNHELAKEFQVSY